jgi:hypothetical protein
MSARAQNQSASAIAAPAPEVRVQDPKESSATRQADIDDLQIRLDEAERVARDLQAEVSYIVSNAHPMNPTAPRAIALKEARDRATELRTAFLEARAALYREELATVAVKFVECAKTFCAEIGPNGWANCSDAPPDALAACLDPIIDNLAACQVSVPRIFNQLQHVVQGAVPPACSPFMPGDLFDTSGPVRSVIVERIRQRVKDAANHSH